MFPVCPQEKIDIAIAEYNKGLSLSRASIIAGIDPKTLKKRLDRAGIVYIENRHYFKAPIIIGEFLKCALCNLNKKLQEFRIRPGKGNHRGRLSYCKPCNLFYARYTHAITRDKSLGQKYCTWDYWKTTIFNKECFYCGYIASGADRIDNSKGHEEGNLLPACWQCNQARSDDFSVEATKKFIGPAIKAAREFDLRGH